MRRVRPGVILWCGVLLGMHCQPAAGQSLPPAKVTLESAPTLTVRELEQPCRIAPGAKPEMAMQGGHRFEYTSSAATDCIVYAVRNTPGKASVHVKWSDPKNETKPLLCAVKLPECKPCEWILCPRFDPPRPLQFSTMLGYGGPNADNFREAPVAYVSERDRSAAFVPLRSALYGQVGNAQGTPVRLGIEVTSTAREEGSKLEGYYNLTYTVRTVEGTPKVLVGRVPVPGSLVVSWAAAGPGFNNALAEPRTLQPSQTLTVTVAARQIQISSGFPITIFDGNERIAAITAPAYVPLR